MPSAVAALAGLVPTTIRKTSGVITSDAPSPTRSERLPSIADATPRIAEAQEPMMIATLPMK
jgi:hypothetical protein